MVTPTLYVRVMYNVVVCPLSISFFCLCMHFSLHSPLDFIEWTQKKRPHSNSTTMLPSSWTPKWKRWMPSCKKCLSNAKIKQQIFAKHSIDREIQRKKTHTRQMNKARLNMNAVSHSIHSAYFLFINEPAFCSSSFGLTRRYHCLSSLITIRTRKTS